MTTQTDLQIERIRAKILESYEVLEALGAVLPAEQTSYNLVDTIKSLSPEEFIELLTKAGDILVNESGDQVTSEMIHNLALTNDLSDLDLLVTEDSENTMNLDLDTLTDYILD